MRTLTSGAHAFVSKLSVDMINIYVELFVGSTHNFPTHNWTSPPQTFLLRVFLTLYVEKSGHKNA